MPLSIVTKFHEDKMNSVWFGVQTSLIRQIFGQFKGHNLVVSGAIYLVIYLGRDIVPLSIVTKF